MDWFYLWSASNLISELNNKIGFAFGTFAPWGDANFHFSFENVILDLKSIRGKYFVAMCKSISCKIIWSTAKVCKQMAKCLNAWFGFENILSLGNIHEICDLATITDNPHDSGAAGQSLPKDDIMWRVHYYFNEFKPRNNYDGRRRWIWERQQQRRHEYTHMRCTSMWWLYCSCSCSLFTARIVQGRSSLILLMRDFSFWLCVKCFIPSFRAMATCNTTPKLWMGSQQIW